MTNKILITGLPGSGKSTLIKRVVGRLNKPLTGFLTEEIREKGRRVGFSIVTLGGKRGMLAHVKSKGTPRVGKYRVCLSDLEKIAVPSIIPANPEVVVIVDEIGKMECFSPLFRKKIVEVLDSHPRVLATIALHGNTFIEQLKKRPDVEIIRITHENRDDLVDIICSKFN